MMTNDDEIGFPRPNGNETELLLEWLGYLRGAVIRKIEGLSDEQSRWTPDGALISVLGIVNHLTNVEWRWIDGGIRGEPVSKDDGEYRPGVELTVSDAVARYRARGVSTDATARSLPLDAPCALNPGADLRWVLLHLINETARHAGHADATRELLDGTTGE